MISICLPLIALLVAQSLNSALAELNKGRVLESIEQFKQIIRSDPGNGPAYFYLSKLYTQMAEYTMAERYLQRAMDLNPKQSAYYHQLGFIRYRQKQWRPALALFKQALEIGGGGTDEAAVWRSLGDVQLELFDPDAALQAYERALGIQSQNAATRFALGRLYLERSQPDRAISHLRAAMEIDPLLHGVYPVLGRAYRQIGDLQSAMTVLKQALDTDPADQESRYALGQVLLALGRIDEGRVELQKYERIRQQVSSANNDYENALSLIEVRQFSQAEKLLRESIRLAPTYGPALHSLGTLLLDGGSPERSAEILKRAVQASPLNAESWFNLAVACFKTGRLADAREAAKWATVLNDEDSRYQRLLREIQEKAKK
jgi:tetratricopeptide (TPR) repeat protein